MEYIRKADDVMDKVHELIDKLSDTKDVTKRMITMGQISALYWVLDIDWKDERL